MTPLKMGVMGLVVFILVVLFLGMLMKGARGFEGFQEGEVTIGGYVGQSCDAQKPCKTGLTCNSNRCVSPTGTTQTPNSPSYPSPSGMTPPRMTPPSPPNQN
jgi:hypothetical protein